MADCHGYQNKRRGPNTGFSDYRPLYERAYLVAMACPGPVGFNMAAALPSAIHGALVSADCESILAFAAVVAINPHIPFPCRCRIA